MEEIGTIRQILNRIQTQISFCVKHMKESPKDEYWEGRYWALPWIYDVLSMEITHG